MPGRCRSGLWPRQPRHGPASLFCRRLRPASPLRRSAASERAICARNPRSRFVKERLDRACSLVEERLGKARYFAGEGFTAADIMMVFSLTTMRYFMPLDLVPYPNILSYLQRIGGREAYQAAMLKADPEMTPLLM
jgi:glutathione S-transferase